MSQVLTIEAVRRAVDTLKAGYRPAAPDDAFVVYMRREVFLMMHRTRSWWRITDRRAEIKAGRRRAKQASRVFIGGRVRTMRHAGIKG